MNPQAANKLPGEVHGEPAAAEMEAAALSEMQGDSIPWEMEEY